MFIYYHYYQPLGPLYIYCIKYYTIIILQWPYNLVIDQGITHFEETSVDMTHLIVIPSQPSNQNMIKVELQPEQQSRIIPRQTCRCNTQVSFNATSIPISQVFLILNTKLSNLYIFSNDSTSAGFYSYCLMLMCLWPYWLIGLRLGLVSV